MNEPTIQYHRCKPWELFFFSTKDIVPNVFLFLMNFISYLAVGYYGILVGVAGIIVTSSRVLDGVTDPIIAFVVDRTDSKFGRYRPGMVIGYAIIAVSLILMFFVGVGSNIVVFILIYALYIIGYTFFNTAANGARSVLTNDPKQRANNGRINGMFIMALATGFSLYTSWYIMPKYQGLNLDGLHEMCITALIVGGVFTVFTCLGIASKDKPEFYGNIVNERLKFRDIFRILKGNRPLQMVILAATSDKLALQMSSNSSVIIMVMGIIVGNYAFNGTLGLYSLIPGLLMLFFGMGLAGKHGYKRTVTYAAWGAIISSVVIFLILWLGTPTNIGVTFGATALYVVFSCLRSGFTQIGSSCTPPMIADVADYELYRTGKFAPGVASACWSFVDKVISSLSTTIVAFMLAAIGFKDVLPQVTDSYSSPIFWVAMVIFIGFPIIGWLCSIIAMKFYELSPEKMREIQASNAERRAAQKANAAK